MRRTSQSLLGASHTSHEWRMLNLRKEETPGILQAANLRQLRREHGYIKSVNSLIKLIRPD